MEVEFLQEKIFELSKKERITQEKIAKAADVSTVTVNGWINGKRTPTISAIVRLCNKFEIPLNYFFSGAIPQDVLDESEELKKRNAELESLNEELSKEMRNLKKELAMKAIEQQKVESTLRLEYQKAENDLRIEFQNELHAQSAKFYEEKTELKLNYELKLQELEIHLRLAKNGKLKAIPHSAKEQPVIVAEETITYNAGKETEKKEK